MLHGATEENMTPAYEGLIVVLNETAPIGMLTDALMKCAKITEKVIPKIVKQKILDFEKSHTNFVRSVNILYKGGIASKHIGKHLSRYNNIRYSVYYKYDLNMVATGQEMVREKNSSRSGNFMLSQEKFKSLRAIREK